eukprot:5523161-Prymnesium_polylepis.1
MRRPDRGTSKLSVHMTSAKRRARISWFQDEIELDVAEAMTRSHTHAQTNEERDAGETDYGIEAEACSTSGVHSVPASSIGFKEPLCSHQALPDIIPHQETVQKALSTDLAVAFGMIAAVGDASIAQQAPQQSGVSRGRESERSVQSCSSRWSI